LKLKKMIAQLQSTPVLEKNLRYYLDRSKRIILNQGGTGSSKSYSLAQMFASMMIREQNARITICRKTFPSLRATAMHDFFEVIRNMGAYREEWHNRSENIYHYAPSGTDVDFISVDEPMKVRSRRRDFLWINEANELKREDFEQLNMRTNKMIWMDYNPSDLFHWIYDEIEPRPDCALIVSTYKDNPFLPAELIKEIENYRNKDQNYWRVYGLGQKGAAETLIYKHWTLGDRFENPDKIFYGLDFGFNNPTGLVRVEDKDQDRYAEEVLYERYLTNRDLIGRLTKLSEDKVIEPDATIYADNAEPARIEEIRQAGFNIVACTKGEVKDGIDNIKSHKLIICRGSVNLQKEARSYSWKEKGGKPMEESVKENDHLLDALRYAIISEEHKIIPGIDWG
jgi:phage terminase large subunit